MTAAVRRVARDIVTRRGWQPGSDLEDAAALRLSGAFRLGEVRQQHRAGMYRLDFAWPDVMVAMEVDGWHHRSPDSAAHDAERDAWLRSEGWLVLRVDDRHGIDCMDQQVVRVCRLIHALRRLGDVVPPIHRQPVTQ